MDYTPMILIEGSNLSQGENTRVVCPACAGGSSGERSLSITLGEDNILRWQCFRGSCHLSPGMTGTDPSSQALYIHTKKHEVVKPRRKFDGKTTALSERDLAWIEEHWGITEPPYWYYTPNYGGRIAMSIRSPKYKHRGWVLRDIRGRAKRKALTYIDEKEQGLSWYKTKKHGPTIVVEDIPSSVRASRYVNAVALCGTGLGYEKAEELSMYGSRPIVMCLDQDAVDLSFKYIKKYGLLWGDSKVLPLKKDIKDMNEQDIKELLNERETCTRRNN